MLKKRQNKQMMNDQNHSPQKELSLEHLWAADQETEDKDETISSTSTQILIEKRWRENSSIWPPIINRSEKVSRNW